MVFVLFKESPLRIVFPKGELGLLTTGDIQGGLALTRQYNLLGGPVTINTMTGEGVLQPLEDFIAEKSARSFGRVIRPSMTESDDDSSASPPLNAIRSRNSLEIMLTELHIGYFFTTLFYDEAARQYLVDLLDILPERLAGKRESSDVVEIIQRLDCLEKLAGGSNGDIIRYVATMRLFSLIALISYGCAEDVVACSEQFSQSDLEKGLRFCIVNEGWWQDLLPLDLLQRAGIAHREHYDTINPSSKDFLAIGQCLIRAYLRRVPAPQQEEELQWIITLAHLCQRWELYEWLVDFLNQEKSSDSTEEVRKSRKRSHTSRSDEDNAAITKKSRVEEIVTSDTD